jgi:hypothetical protein
MKFDPTAATLRVNRLWSLKAKFGVEGSAYACYLNEIVSDRYTLVNGLQLLRDELQLADADTKSDLVACGADMSVPTVVTTVAHTNCGDRIHQGEATTAYENVVARRFATMSEIGELKLEAFSPTGGGTDDGATLAHVTVAHQLDEPLRRKLYSGHAQSFVVVAIDVKTHVGRLDENGEALMYGKTRESPWRQPRTACGALVGTLTHYNDANAVHRRLRADLGETNFEFLSKTQVMTTDGKTDITAAIGAAIVSIQGMLNTARALTTELDERGVGHVTASITVNRISTDDPVIYLARATVYGGTLAVQGLGTDAQKYSGRMVQQGDDSHLVLTYDSLAEHEYPIVQTTYEVVEKSWAYDPQEYLF